MSRRSRCLSMLLLLLVDQSSVVAWQSSSLQEHRAVRARTSPLVSSKERIQIRSTQESDLTAIATMLSTASVPESAAWNWKTNIDQLWAKNDIELLLRGRLTAIQEGKKASIRIPESQDDYDSWWTSSDRFRNCIATASTETGEDNVWRHHNLSVPPRDSSWLNHLQMTALIDQQVVGFCEVAMLSNPLLQHEQQECILNSFSPAITNLATSREHRRKGIATRLLSSAQRFARQQWCTEQLGLYVEKDNDAALSLYLKMGFEPKESCDGGEHLGPMFYMSNDLQPVVRGKVVAMRQ
jgi:ribosomal protein S18 acetylase RimI-like enzyme